MARVAARRVVAAMADEPDHWAFRVRQDERHARGGPLSARSEKRAVTGFLTKRQPRPALAGATNVNLCPKSRGNDVMLPCNRAVIELQGANAVPPIYAAACCWHL